MLYKFQLDRSSFGGVSHQNKLLIYTFTRTYLYAYHMSHTRSGGRCHVINWTCGHVTPPTPVHNFFQNHLKFKRSKISTAELEPLYGWVTATTWMPNLTKNSRIGRRRFCSHPTKTDTFSCFWYLGKPVCIHPKILLFALAIGQRRRRQF